MPETPHQPAADDQDASMDTILASIRRIIMEDEAGASPPDARHPAPDNADDELLVLQSSMIVEAETSGKADMAELLPTHQAGASAQSASDLAAALFDMPGPAAAAPPAPEPAVPVPAPVPVVVAMPQSVAPPPPDRQGSLLAPAASLAAAQALASLQDAIRPEPEAPSAMRLLRSGGPTLEDMVREELRGQLKQWLDSHLPSLVERLVAQEIGRLVGRG